MYPAARTHRWRWEVEHKPRVAVGSYEMQTDGFEAILPTQNDQHQPEKKAGAVGHNDQAANLEEKGEVRLWEDCKRVLALYAGDE